jgi:hypothetical protein
MSSSRWSGRCRAGVASTAHIATHSMESSSLQGKYKTLMYNIQCMDHLGSHGEAATRTVRLARVEPFPADQAVVGPDHGPRLQHQAHHVRSLRHLGSETMGFIRIGIVYYRRESSQLKDRGGQTHT